MNGDGGAAIFYPVLTPCVPVEGIVYFSLGLSCTLLQTLTYLWMVEDRPMSIVVTALTGLALALLGITVCGSDR